MTQHLTTYAELVEEVGSPHEGGGNSHTALRAKHLAAQHRSATDGLLSTIEKRGDSQLNADEQRAFDFHRSEIALLDTAAGVWDARTARADQVAADCGHVGMRSGTFHTSGGETYHRGETSPSFFRDLRDAKRGDFEAMNRLQRNNTERMATEKRALGNTGAVGGSGGEFAPPEWLLEDFVKLARAGRVTADLFHQQPLPAGVSSVNLPRVGTGTTAAVQSTQNTALSQTDLTTNALSATVVTIGGKQVVARQLLDQSGIPFDRIVLEDIAADYARQMGSQVLTGPGTGGQLRGYLTPTSANSQTWTQAAPTAALFYSQLAKLQGAINATRFTSPDAVVMHPRRWAWFASFTDSTGRPLVVPASGGFNSMANPGDNAAAGHVGSVLGMDVYTDPSIPTNLGAGANQDVVLMFPRNDIWLWESPLRAESFEDTYADSAGVLFRVLGYSAMIPDRYLTALGQLQGTGLVTPTFAG